MASYPDTFVVFSADAWFQAANEWPTKLWCLRQRHGPLLVPGPWPPTGLACGAAGTPQMLPNQGSPFPNRHGPLPGPTSVLNGCGTLGSWTSDGLGVRQRWGHVPVAVGRRGWWPRPGRPSGEFRVPCDFKSRLSGKTKVSDNHTFAKGEIFHRVHQRNN